MRGNANAIPAPILLGSKLDAAANAAATKIITGGAGISWVLVGVEWSYQGGTPVGTLAILFAGVAVKSYDIVLEGHDFLDFSTMGPMGGLPAPIGVSLGVSLTAGGVGITGKVNITYR